MTPLHHGPLLNYRNVLHTLDEVVHHLGTDLGMGDLTAAETDGDLDLVAVLQELDGILGLDGDVIFRDRCGKLDFLDLDGVLVLP